MPNIMGKRELIVRWMNYLPGESKFEIVREKFNESSKKWEKTSPIHLDPLKTRMTADLKNLMCAYFAFLPIVGKDMRGPIRPGGEWGPRPAKFVTKSGKERPYQKGCRFLLQIDGEKETRDWVVVNTAIWEEIAEIHGKYLDHRDKNPGKVPVLGFTALDPRPGANDNTVYIPKPGIVEWVPRPSALPDVPAVNPPRTATELRWARNEKRDDDGAGGGAGNGAARRPTTATPRRRRRTTTDRTTMGHPKDGGIRNRDRFSLKRRVSYPPL